MSKKRILQEGLAGQALEAEAEKTAQAAAEAAEAALLQANEAIESKKRKVWFLYLFENVLMLNLIYIIYFIEIK